VRPPSLRKVGAGRAPSLHLYPGICLTTEENHGKTHSGYPKGARLNRAERDSFSRLACWPLPPWLSPQATESTLGQLKYLPSCRTRGFPNSADFESKLAIRALMWSANTGITFSRPTGCNSECCNRKGLKLSICCTINTTICPQTCQERINQYNYIIIAIYTTHKAIYDIRLLPSGMWRRAVWLLNYMALISENWTTVTAFRISNLTTRRM
jgi:hypothetical protein